MKKIELKMKKDIKAQRAAKINKNSNYSYNN